MTAQLYWLSFADGSRPFGDQFLGACVVRADNIASAALVAHMLGINPGGEVAGHEIPRERGAELPEKYLDRLLTRADCEEMDRELTGDA